MSVFVILALVYVLWFYQRERRVLNKTLSCILPALRILVFVGAVLFFLAPTKRIDQIDVRDSVVVVLLDTSQSMSIEDEEDKDGSRISRVQSAAKILAESAFIDRLNEEHDVSVAVFDETYKSIFRAKRSKRGGLEVGEADAVGGAFDWSESILPQGRETRIGDALQAVMENEDRNPLAGIIILTDGGQTSGLKPVSVAEKAREQSFPVHLIGFGSTAERRNLKVEQMKAPSRVYPNDSTIISGVIHGEGFAGRTVSVELLARSVEANTVSELIGQNKLRFQRRARI